MNLKRAFIALGAMLLGVGFFGAFPQQALAYTPKPPCVPFNSPGTSWPTNGHFFICDGTYQSGIPASAEALSARQAANNTVAALKTKLLAAEVDVFFFYKPEDANVYPDFIYAAPVGADSRGFTTNTQGPYHIKPAILIFAKGCAAPYVPPFGGCPVYVGQDIIRSTNHEIGHAMDIVMGRPSLLSPYQNMLAQDFADFDAITYTFPVANPCTTGTNSQKLICWFQHQTSDPNELAKEFFAEEYAAGASGGTLPAQAGTVLKNYFKTGGMPPSATQRSYTRVQDLANTP